MNLIDLVKSFLNPFSEQDPYSNEYLVAKTDFDTAENEPRKVWITDFADHIPNVWYADSR